MALDEAPGGSQSVNLHMVGDTPYFSQRIYIPAADNAKQIINAYRLDDAFGTTPAAVKLITVTTTAFTKNIIAVRARSVPC